MSRWEIAALVAAVLLFWSVGAYNRLVRLRGAILQAFAPLDAQLSRRNELLTQWLQAQAHADAHSVQAACRQAAIAAEHVRRQPTDAGAVASLRLAEAVLAEARQRLADASTPASPDDGPAWPVPLAAADIAVDYERTHFDAAALAYNRAVRQFPALLVARLFGLRPGALLQAPAPDAAR